MKNYLPISYKSINLKVSTSSLLIYLLGFIIILAIYLQPYVPVEKLVKDTVVVTGGKFYHGLLSNIGLFLWCATASLCFYTYLILRKSSNTHHRKFAFCGAGLSAILLLDDFLLLHEVIFPFYLGISENYLFIFYPLALITFVLYFLKEILVSQVLLFFSALGFLALSIVFDKIFPQTGPIIIIEDGLKFLGIIGWFFYFSQTCLDLLKFNFKLKKAGKRKDFKQIISSPKKGETAL